MFCTENSQPSIHLLFPNPRTKHNSKFLINLCRCGKSLWNCDWWNFSPQSLLSPHKSTKSLLWTTQMKFLTSRNAHQPRHLEMKVSVNRRERHCGAQHRSYFTKLDTISSLFTHPKQWLFKIRKKKKKKNWSNCRLMKNASYFVF